MPDACFSLYICRKSRWMASKIPDTIIHFAYHHHYQLPSIFINYAMPLIWNQYNLWEYLLFFFYKMSVNFSWPGIWLIIPMLFISSNFMAYLPFSAKCGFKFYCSIYQPVSALRFTFSKPKPICTQLHALLSTCQFFFQTRWGFY